MRRRTIRNQRTGQIVATVEVAGSSAERRRGLLGRDGLEPGAGLLIRPCEAVHTFFMRFAIDAVFIDRRGEVVRVAPCLAPWRMAWGGWRAHDVIELAAGAAAAAGIAVGDRLIEERAEPL